VASCINIASLMLVRVLTVALVLLAVLLTLTILLCWGTVAASRVLRRGRAAENMVIVAFGVGRS